MIGKNFTGFNFKSYILQKIINVNRTDEDMELITRAKKNNKIITDKLKEIYVNINGIIYNDDSFFCISEEQRNQLKNYLDKLYDLKDLVSENEEIIENYHNNILVTLFYIKSSYLIDYFKNCLPSSLKKKEKNVYIYACMLYNEKKYTDSLKEFQNMNKLYNNNYLVEEIACLFQLENYTRIIALTKSMNKKNYDRHGYIAMYEILSKNKKNKLKENEIIEMNAQYKNFTLYNSLAANLLYEIDPTRLKRIKSYVKRSLELIEENGFDYNVLCSVYLQIKNLDAGDFLINFLKKYYTHSLLVVYMIFELYSSRIEINDSDYVFLTELIDYAKDMKLNDINYTKYTAHFALKSGKKIEALKNYDKVFELESDVKIALKCLELSVETGEEINKEKYKSVIFNCTDSIILMDSAFFYKELGDTEFSKKLALIALCCNVDYHKDIELLGKFVNIFKENIGNKKEDDIYNNIHICMKNCSNNKEKNILISDLIKFNHSHYNAQMIDLNSNEAMEFIKIKKGDIFDYQNVKYIIEEIEPINYYFFKLFINSKEKINSKNPGCIKTISGNDMDEMMKQITEVLTDSKENELKNYDRYDIEKREGKLLNTIPLLFLRNNKDDSYLQIISNLLYDENRRLYAGYLNRFDINNNNFVLDISSIIFMAIIDKLHLLKEIKNNIYITKSTFNRIKKNLNTVCKKNVGQEYIGIDKDNRPITYAYTKEDKKVESDFYRNIIYFIKDCNIVDYETKPIDKNLDKVQCDAIMLSLSQNYVFISDDLFIKELYCRYKSNIKLSNSALFIDILLETNLKNYIECICELAKLNYLYCMDPFSIEKILKLDLENQLDSYIYEKLKDIIQYLCKTKFLFKLNLCLFKIVFIEEGIKYRNTKSYSIIKKMITIYYINYFEVKK